ncbi:hypothetical protein ACWF0M_09355 [Kribbella sp. NPDC055110]
MDDKFTPVLLASVLTLMATVLVKAFVIPWVQARTRRIERWETSVVELASLVDDTFPRVVAEFRSAAQTELIYRSILDNPDFDQDRLREALPQAKTARQQADDIVDQHRRRLKILVNRVAKRRSRAVFWAGFRTRELLMDFKLSNVTSSMVMDELQSPDDEKWTTAWAEYQASAKEFSDLVDELASAMRPPALELRKRFLRRSKTWLKAHVGRGSRPSAAVTSGDNPDTTPAPSP